MDQQDRKNRYGMNNGFGSIDEMTRKDRIEVPNSGDNDNGDQQEVVEQLRKQMEKLQNELTDALQEAEVSKQRRDWVFAERDKVVMERESIRTLCDRLRRERDRAVSDLAEALRDTDDVKRQRNDSSKELKGATPHIQHPSDLWHISVNPGVILTQIFNRHITSNIITALTDAWFFFQMFMSISSSLKLNHICGTLSGLHQVCCTCYLTFLQANDLTNKSKGKRLCRCGHATSSLCVCLFSNDFKFEYQHGGLQRYTRMFFMWI